jgi:hypothetical protein
VLREKAESRNLESRNESRTRIGLKSRKLKLEKRNGRKTYR